MSRDALRLTEHREPQRVVEVAALLEAPELRGDGREQLTGPAHPVEAHRAERAGRCPERAMPDGVGVARRFGGSHVLDAVAPAALEQRDRPFGIRS
jgi:hypothetical protein